MDTHWCMAVGNATDQSWPKFIRLGPNHEYIYMSKRVSFTMIDNYVLSKDLLDIRGINFAH